jgi:2-hydroxychromene-2-carboxylate isomerase
MQKKKAVWFFDFISPYAYIQSKRLKYLQSFLDIKLIPVLFAGLLNHFGQLGPAEIKFKRQHTFRQCLFITDRKGIKFKLPAHHPFNPLFPLRACILKNNSFEAVTKIFDFIWTTGKNIDDLDSQKYLLDQLEISDISLLSNDNIKQKLKENTSHATQKGIFGVPSFYVDNEIFWGQDSEELLVLYIENSQNTKQSYFNPVDQFPESKINRRK